MLEICGNIILEIKDLEDLTPVKLANHKNPLEPSCGSKDNCKDTKCSDKKESVFGQTFSKYQKSTTFHLIGNRTRFTSHYTFEKIGQRDEIIMKNHEKSLQHDLLWTLPKFFYGMLFLSMFLSHFDTFGKFSRVIYAAVILGAVMMVMKNQGHRIPHPCALPNPIFKGIQIQRP